MEVRVASKGLDENGSAEGLAESEYGIHAFVLQPPDPIDEIVRFEDTEGNEATAEPVSSAFGNEDRISILQQERREPKSAVCGIGDSVAYNYRTAVGFFGYEPPCVQQRVVWSANAHLSCVCLSGSSNAVRESRGVA